MTIFTLETAKKSRKFDLKKEIDEFLHNQNTLYSLHFDYSGFRVMFLLLMEADIIIDISESILVLIYCIYWILFFYFIVIILYLDVRHIEPIYH